MTSRGPIATKVETCTVGMARRVAAMLDLDPEAVAAAGVLPRGWHFPLLAAETRRSDLREDGFPGLGVPMPDFGLPRLLLAGRTVEYGQDIPLGATIRRESSLGEIKRKEDALGVRATVSIIHKLAIEAEEPAAVIETQTYMLLPAARYVVPVVDDLAVDEPIVRTVNPDETLLFQYSALCFNSHRIHLDRRHSQEVEGFPDLVVNGGLSTLLLTEALRATLGLTLRSIRLRYVAPLFVDRPITLTVSGEGEVRRLRAYTDRGHIAVDAEGIVA